MIRVAAGHTRVVLLIGRFVLKMPRPDLGSRHFVLGLLGNLNERMLSLSAGGDPRMSRTYWCAPLGLLVLAERVGEPVLRRLTREELFSLPLQEFTGESGVDDNGHNVAARGEALVVFDYGNPGLMYVPEGPRLVHGQPR